VNNINKSGGGEQQTKNGEKRKQMKHENVKMIRGPPPPFFCYIYIYNNRNSNKQHKQKAKTSESK